MILDISGSDANRLDPDGPEPAFDAPLTGFCSASDQVWEHIALDIGPFHWTPLEAFRLAYPDENPDPAGLSVVAWVLPQSKATRDDHRKARGFPSKRWSQARLHGEMFNEFLRTELVRRLGQAGVQAAAPALLPEWRREISDRHGYASTWSERHAAFACGLGTFGLSDGLITPAGKAVRVGSAVVRLTLPSSGRPYGMNHRAYCLFFATGKCQACAGRCPAKAISPLGHDKVACKRYIREVTSPHVESAQLGVPVNSCGLCQTAVPCEAGIPHALRKRD